MELYNARLQRIKAILSQINAVSADVAELFAADMVDVVIPEGHDESDYLIQRAFERGIRTGKLPGNSHIPAQVTEQLQCTSLGALYQGLYGKRASKQIHVVKSSQDLKQLHVVIEQLRKLADGDTLLFHGVVNGTVVTKMMTNRIQYVGRDTDNLNELGDGIYCAYDFDFVYRHISQYTSGGQAILVFNWSAVDSLSSFHVHGNEWKKVVKQNICLYDSKKMQQLGYPQDLAEQYDVVQGQVTRNYKAIQSCAEPISSSVTQVVVLRDQDKILIPRLLAVIFIL
ncbi:hypothetical protein MP228_009020 [Amoeboaphelidium protococcarum]|nr:hypothetical protein MP228_009020 [Amoeboaphelidium protococcarum]